ncbi:MAG: DUF1952 domain-containing protein, partial [Planctomycetota bacterium]
RWRGDRALPGEVREVRGIPLWLLREYLEEAGGRRAGDDRVVGDGWSARLTQLDDHRVGSLRVGQVRIELDGEAEPMARLRAFLDPKLLRAGG